VVVIESFKASLKENFWAVRFHSSILFVAKLPKLKCCVEDSHANVGLLQGHFCCQEGPTSFEEFHYSH